MCRSTSFLIVGELKDQVTAGARAVVGLRVAAGLATVYRYAIGVEASRARAAGNTCTVSAHVNKWVS